MLDLDRIEALANAATPGPWKIDREEIDNEDGVLDGDILGCPRSIGPLALIDHESLDADTVEADAAFIAAAREDVPALVAELRATRADLTVAAADRDLYRDLYRQVYDAVAGESLGSLPTRDIVAAAVAHREAHAEIERLRTAAADERADVVAYMSRVAANLRRQRPRTDYLDTEADTYERASDAIADECHVGAANGGDHG